MFKKGDIVVKLGKKNIPIFGSNDGDVWMVPDVFRNNKAVYLSDGKYWSSKVRKATDNEIKWFEAGVTNINQIPVISSNFWLDGEIKTISGIGDKIVQYNENWDYMSYSQYIKLVNNVNEHKKGCVKTNYLEQFKIEDLRNCKIGSLTPEDHEIIQPWLFSLGYKWFSGKTQVNSSWKVLFLTGDRIHSGSAGKHTNIKKETILNYINNEKQSNNDVLTKNPEISRNSINGTARMASRRQQSSVGSRPKGNKTSFNCRKAIIRQSKIRGQVGFV